MSLRWIGVIAVGLAVTGISGWLVGPFDMPEDASALASHYSDHRGAILLYAYSGLLGAAAQLIMFVGLRQVSDGDSRAQFWARLGLSSMLIEVAGVSIAFTIFAAVAHREPEPDAAQLLTDIAWLTIDSAAGPATALGLLAFALALVRSGLVGRWLVLYTCFVSLAHLAVAAAFARSGFFAPHGDLAFFVPLVFFSWFAFVGISLLRRSRTEWA